MIVQRQVTQERRTSQRVPLHTALGFRALDEHPPQARHGMTLDVSSSGVRFRSPAFLAAGSFLAVDLSLPRWGTHSSRARTVWVREAPGGDYWEAGAAFLRKEGEGDAELAEILLLGA